MSDVSVHIQTSDAAPRFRATSGEKCAVGNTMGDALNTLVAEWDNMPHEADVHIEAIAEPAPEDYEEYHLKNKNGLWVVAVGPPMSPEDAELDWVRQDREARIRSFFPAELRNVELDDDYA